MGGSPTRGAWRRFGLRGRYRRVLRARGRRLGRCEDGSITLEVVLWLPIYVTVLAVAADISLVQTANADMWHVAYDTARRMSREELTAEEAPALVRAHMPKLSDALSVESRSGAEWVELRISAPASAAAATALIPLLGETRIAARVRLPKSAGPEPDYGALSRLGLGAGGS